MAGELKSLDLKEIASLLKKGQPVYSGLQVAEVLSKKDAEIQVLRNHVTDGGGALPDAEGLLTCLKF